MKIKMSTPITDISSVSLSVYTKSYQTAWMYCNQQTTTPYYPSSSLSHELVDEGSGKQASHDSD